MKIDVLTAKPALELMLASNSQEAPYSNFPLVWEVFVNYLRVPAEAVEDIACFQTSLLADAPDEEPGVVFILGRQLSDAAGDTRCVQLQFTLGDAYSGSLDDVDVWSSDFPDLQAFVQFIEQLPHFRLLKDDSEPCGELFVEFIQ